MPYNHFTKPGALRSSLPLQKVIQMDKGTYKVILLGDASVGKTSLARRQATGTFDFRMMPTVGCDYLASTVEIDRRSVKLMLWDTAGQEQFASLVPMYVRGANACVIVASIVDPHTLEHMESWLNLLHQSGEKPPVVVAVNKTDLVDESTTQREEIQAKYGHLFPEMFFVSAQNGDSVQPLFQHVGIAAMKFKPSTDGRTTGGVVEDWNVGESECGC
jgi:small GTP-binding protein